MRRRSEHARVLDDLVSHHQSAIRAPPCVKDTFGVTCSLRSAARYSATPRRHQRSSILKLCMPHRPPSPLVRHPFPKCKTAPRFRRGRALPRCNSSPTPKTPSNQRKLTPYFGSSTRCSQVISTTPTPPDEMATATPPTQFHLQPRHRPHPPETPSLPP